MCRRRTDFCTSLAQNLASMRKNSSELLTGDHRTWSPLRHFRRPDPGTLIRFRRLPVACEPFRPCELRRCQTRRNTLVSGPSPVAMDAACASGRHEEPGTSMYEGFRRSWDTSVHLSELTLSTWQTLFGGSQQPLHRLGSVARDGVAVVIQSTVVENTKIKLRRGVAAFGGNKEVPHSAAAPCIRASKPLGGRGIASELASRRLRGDCRGVTSRSCEILYDRHMPQRFYMGLK